MVEIKDLAEDYVEGRLDPDSACYRAFNVAFMHGMAAGVIMSKKALKEAFEDMPIQVEDD